MSHHVFVCYSALSFDAAVRISHDGVPKEEKIYFFLTFSTDTSAVPAGSHVYSMSPPPEAYSEWKKPFAIARWFAAALAQANLPSSSIVAYLPHPFELPGNHFLFHDDRVEQAELLPDGLLNYMTTPLRPENARLALRYLARVALRKIASRRYGLKYQSLKWDHITQYRSANYTRSWCYNEAGYITRVGDVQKLPDREDTSLDSSGKGPALLILDQEIHLIVSPALERKMREQLLALVAQSELTRVFYKAHPRGKNRHSELCQSIPHLRDISGPALAENLVPQQNIIALIGFYSTPLALTIVPPIQKRTAILPLKDDSGVLRPSFVHALRDALSSSGAEVVTP